MIITNVYQLKSWLKDHRNPHCRRVFLWLKQMHAFELPSPAIYNHMVYGLYQLFQQSGATLLRWFVYTPVFRAQANQVGQRLNLYGGTPYISGPLQITVGSDCRISGQTTFSGRSHSEAPALIIGNNVGIGWQTTIAVGTKIILEDNVRIAGRAFLCGYSGHPIDAERRAKGEPDDLSQIGDIHLEKDVWLGTNVSVHKSVTIGQGTIVASGSVVINDLPPFVIAAGNPAIVIKAIK